MESSTYMLVSSDIEKISGMMEVYRISGWSTAEMEAFLRDGLRLE